MAIVGFFKCGGQGPDLALLRSRRLCRSLFFASSEAHSPKGARKYFRCRELKPIHGGWASAAGKEEQDESEPSEARQGNDVRGQSGLTSVSLLGGVVS